VLIPVSISAKILKLLSAIVVNSKIKWRVFIPHSVECLAS